MNAVAALSKPSADAIEQLSAIVGEKNLLREAADKQPYELERRDKYFGKAAVVLRPGSAAEIAEILKLANREGLAIIPQGGNTGLVGAQTPFEHGGEIVVSLERLNRIRMIDATDNTLIVEAGATLQSVKDAAVAAQRFFPLSLGAQGSCQIGGNLSSNAGGINVLHYGNMRDLCLGLEVVLADGRIWDGLRLLRKDNTGYDLKDLFIGAEGTLGIITAAALKLFPLTASRCVCWCATPTPKAGLELLHLARAQTSGIITAIELIPQIAVEFAGKHAGLSDPLGDGSPWNVLLQLESNGPFEQVQSQTGSLLEQALENGCITNATIAQSQSQERNLWEIRERLSDIQKFEGGSIKHDVSVPVSRTPELIDKAIAACHQLEPGCRPVAFGHLGDGNIHFNISQPPGADREAFLARWDEFNDVIHTITLDLGGSISAEHGIGRLKRHLMQDIKSPVELDMMRQLKSLFDPNGILNPGKLLS